MFVICIQVVMRVAKAELISTTIIMKNVNFSVLNVLTDK